MSLGIRKQTFGSRSCRMHLVCLFWRYRWRIPRLFFVGSGNTEWLNLDSLEGKGYQHVKVHNGFEALNAIASNGVDLVVAESELPDIAGFQLCTLIKTNDQTAGLPVVIVTPDEGNETNFWKQASYADYVFNAF